VSRRLRTTEHNHRRSSGCTRHPGRLDTPKGAAANRRAGSRLPEQCSCRAARPWAGLNEPPPRPAGPNGDLDASIETAPSHGIDGLFNGASSRRCCHRCRLMPRIPPLHQTRQIQTLELGRRPLPLGILSVGYTGVTDGCPPSTSAFQRKRCCHHLRPSAWKRPADAGSGWNPAATLPPRRDPHRPSQTRDSGYLRNAERADWSRDATR